MLVVLDTNLLVSALLTPHGAPARILDLVLNGEVRLALDDRILAEYREVLVRPKFDFASEDVDTLLDYLQAEGEQLVARPLPIVLPDPEDLAFLEVATAARAVLVTGNTKHFPEALRGTTSVITPRELLDIWTHDPR